ncbi:MAG: hypothetical protein AAF206_27605 [Bacteroidota bacterium]
MSRYQKIFLAIALVILMTTQERICSHAGFGQLRYHQAAQGEQEKQEFTTGENHLAVHRLSDETIYRWDERRMNWVPDESGQSAQTSLVDYTTTNRPLIPIKIEWNVLMDIQYQLKYFKAIDMEMYAPIFSEDVKALNGREILIEGFVIPLGHVGDTLSLSYNPYASCFFCGKASPASVMSMYFKEKPKRYKMDAFRTFKGRLSLNRDDPNEFYYILHDAEDVTD